MSYPCLNVHRRSRKGNIILPEESHWYSMGKLHTGLRVGFYTIYLHKCESKLKCITAVDLKTTLDPQPVSFHIYGCYVTIWEPKVTFDLDATDLPGHSHVFGTAGTSTLADGKD